MDIDSTMNINSNMNLEEFNEEEILTIRIPIRDYDELLEELSTKSYDAGTHLYLRMFNYMEQEERIKYMKYNLQVESNPQGENIGN